MSKTIPGGYTLSSAGQPQNAAGQPVDEAHESEVYPGAAWRTAAATETGRDTAASTAGSLPPGFPGLAVLLAAGHDTPEKVAALSREDLIALDGIGPAKADQILALRNA